MRNTVATKQAPSNNYESATTEDKKRNDNHAQIPQQRSVWVCVSRASATQGSYTFRPARGLVVRAFTSVLVGREFGRVTPRPGHTKTLQEGTATFLPGARCAEELQGTHPELRNKPSDVKSRNCPNSVVALKDYCSYNAPTTNHHINKI